MNLKVVFLVFVVILLVVFLVHGWPPEPILHWIAVHTGEINLAGVFYGFFSGFGSILERLLELLVIGYLLWRRNNCHHKGCPFIGHYPANEGGGWMYCRRHHNTNGDHL